MAFDPRTLKPYGNPQIIGNQSADSDTSQSPRVQNFQGPDGTGYQAVLGPDGTPLMYTTDAGGGNYQAYKLDPATGQWGSSVHAKRSWNPIRDVLADKKLMAFVAVASAGAAASYAYGGAAASGAGAGGAGAGAGAAPTVAPAVAPAAGGITPTLSGAAKVGGLLGTANTLTSGGGDDGAAPYGTGDNDSGYSLPGGTPTSGNDNNFGGDASGATGAKIPAETWADIAKRYGGDVMKWAAANPGLAASLLGAGAGYLANKGESTATQTTETKLDPTAQAYRDRALASIEKYGNGAPAVYRPGGSSAGGPAAANYGLGGGGGPAPATYGAAPPRQAAGGQTGVTTKSLGDPGMAGIGMWGSNAGGMFGNQQLLQTQGGPASDFQAGGRWPGGPATAPAAPTASQTAGAAAFAAAQRANPNGRAGLGTGTPFTGASPAINAAAVQGRRDVNSPAYNVAMQQALNTPGGMPSNWTLGKTPYGLEQSNGNMAFGGGSMMGAAGGAAGGIMGAPNGGAMGGGAQGGAPPDWAGSNGWMPGVQGYLGQGTAQIEATKNPMAQEANPYLDKMIQSGGKDMRQYYDQFIAPKFASGNSFGSSGLAFAEVAERDRQADNFSEYSQGLRFRDHDMRAGLMDNQAGRQDDLNSGRRNNAINAGQIYGGLASGAGQFNATHDYGMFRDQNLDVQRRIDALIQGGGMPGGTTVTNTVRSQGNPWGGAIAGGVAGANLWNMYNKPTTKG